MKQIFATFYTLLISCLCLSLVFAGPFPETMPNLLDMPPTAPGEAGLIFHYEPGRQILKDLVSKTPWTQTYAGTNRTRINSAGLLETVGANTVAIDHIGASLEPALRLEPAAANILLEVLTDWTDTTLTPVKNATSWAGTANGAYTVTASGANGTLISTAVSASSAAFTFVCAIKRSIGTGAVYMTIDNGATWTEKTLTTSFQYFNVTKTAANPQLGFKLATSGDAIIVDMLALIPNTAIASSSFAPAAAIGSELVTDGGFAAVTVANSYTSDFTVDADGFANSFRIVVAGNVDGIGGYNDVLSATVTADAGTHITNKEDQSFTEGFCYRVRYEYYIPSTNSHLDGVRLYFGSSAAWDISAVLNTWTAVDFYINPSATGNIRFAGHDGVSVTFTDAGADDVFYLKDVIIDAITLTNFTAGTGWAPQTTAGSLTGKAQKIAGTASDLTQTTAVAEAGKVYRVGNTAVRTAGTLTPEFGSTNGAVISANGTYYDYPIAADTDYIKFKADSSFAGSVDVATIKEHGTVRLGEANTTTLAIPAAVAAALADTGTIVIKGRFAFARAAGVVTNILASAAATNSLVYTTTAAGNITSNDGTTIAENTGAYTANTDWKIALKFPSDTDKYRIGIDVAGAGIVWGTEVAFDGAFTATANLILGYVLHGATWIKYIKIYDKVLTDAQINAL